MEFQTLKDMEPEVEKIGEAPVIKIEIELNEAFIEAFRERYDEAKEGIQKEKKEETQQVNQEEIEAIWKQTPPRIP